ncbi:hypothetical protein OE88DRAFT_1641569 [Heliocybe sulcata]|uniref:Uncharacterized protein n=1 Tax=Heliocybe sulcata TaxID=5364 RepID=A0A5C3ND27_9AGAM|nr:hypothetical protein OE88DRAFT_1641569 [Heliocybe sulcata]
MSYYRSPSHHRSQSQQAHAPSYYYPSQQSAYHSPQPVVYTTSDSGHRHRQYSSAGAGGQYYAPQSPHQRGRTYSTSYQGQASPAQYATVHGSHRRHHSTSSPVVVDLRKHHRHSNAHAQPARSASRPRASSHARQYSDRQRRYSEGHLSFADRLRRMLGVGPWAHHDARSHHHSRERFIDAKSGREVDRSGRPIYRV